MIDPLEKGLNAFRQGKYGEALQLLYPIAEQGDPDVQFVLGNYLKSKGSHHNPDEAERWLREAAQQGHDEARWALGQLILDRANILCGEAVGWLCQGAEKNPLFQRELGELYSTGFGYSQEYDVAAAWCKRAADQGDVQACFRLGEIYEKGQGVTEDVAEAARYYARVVREGDPASEFAWGQSNVKLGRMYRDGRGVPQDHIQAMTHFQDAPQNAHAVFEVGNMHLNGLGVERDAVEAVNHYRKAARMGHLDAILTLSQIYCDGADGVSPDPAEALLFATLAGRIGHEGGYDASVEIAALLTDEQRRRNGVQSDEWFRAPGFFPSLWEHDHTLYDLV